jgi:ssDNA-binding Zn-finger/Zn-ribbon topoisomerase 1
MVTKTLSKIKGITMAIDKFNQADFESALPAGAWEALGMVQGEYTYFVKPSDAPPSYGVMVRSSIGQSGIADDCGEDSIRCLLCKKDGDSVKVIGNKAKRWITRVKGWQGRLMETLRHCKAQLSRIRPCPHCAAVLIPFTAHTKENKGRAFVSCRNPDCGKFMEWCDEPIKQVETPTGKVPTPNCPKCNALMSRMSSGKGWRCACPGNAWKDNAWTKCDGVIWDSKPATTGKDAQAPALTDTEKSLRLAIQEAARLLGKLPDKEKSVVALVDMNGDDATALVNFLIDVGNLQAERASVKVKG